MPGFSRGRQLKKIGLPAQDTAELIFEDVFVPDDHLLGVEGGGLAQLKDMLPLERLSIAAQAIAVADTVIATTLEYTTGREAFGQPIADFQNTRFELAELATEADVTRAYVDQCILAWNAGDLTDVDAAKAKWWATDMQTRAGRPLPAAPRRVRLHGRVPSGPRLPGRPGTEDLRRHQRDHEAHHRRRDGANRQAGPSSRLNGLRQGPLSVAGRSPAASREGARGLPRVRGRHRARLLPVLELDGGEQARRLERDPPPLLVQLDLPGAGGHCLGCGLGELSSWAAPPTTLRDGSHETPMSPAEQPTVTEQTPNTTEGAAVRPSPAHTDVGPRRAAGPLTAAIGGRGQAAEPFGDKGDVSCHGAWSICACLPAPDGPPGPSAGLRRLR